MEPKLDPSSYAFKFSMTVLIFASIGSLMQIGAGNWDVTLHLLLIPESFFTPSHTLLYAGIGILSLSAIIGGVLMIKYGELKKSGLTISFKLFIIGSVLSIISGPSDFIWHETFGVDGFLSPTHLMLITGMLINTSAVAMGIVRLNSFVKSGNSYQLGRIFFVPAFVALWLNLISYVYIFALPISNGDLFNFNLNPIAESLIALIFLPLINSGLFLLVLKKTHTFGIASAIAAGAILLTAVTNILPSETLSNLLPFYLLTIIPFVLVDLLIYDKLPLGNKLISNKLKVVISGGISGSLFYIMGYPLLPLTLSNYLIPVDLEQIGFVTIVDIVPFFVNSLPAVLPITLLIGAILGILSAWIYERIDGFKEKNRKSDQVIVE
ncbi:hypothetical protein [Candidatus Nitrosocosmicus arcticus]|uniref:Uncharacterized protein n=1 Tax=Candidatus Nitrosocosmicus arcticus TaxID=2035267 RepID=A0A557SSJ9_9ARCH|nr:hypothetical protein [Candidatus Nitrosocosmicus arcticus]TVP39562.1 conserved membrane protein of unknown function [Candidatus Nitrosocosmicus arcticus]